MPSYRIGLFATLVASVFLLNCNSNAGPGSASSDGGAAGAAGSNDEPAAGAADVSRAALCAISADCPSSSHCDLGECIQNCDDTHACSRGTACSARARCLPENAADVDPTPSTAYLGTVSAAPLTTLLTDSDQIFKVTLTSSGNKLVHYRIQLDAPHLSIKDLRGEFTGSKVVKFTVDVSRLKGTLDIPGSVKFFTDLGDVTVSAPIHTGITGKYRGSLRFDGGLVNLGDARVALDVLETNGDVTVRFDPEQSLLFPESSTGPATGFGSYAEGQPIELNGSQRFERAFGGTRNHFARDIGRRTKLKLTPDGNGNLSGTFEDNIYGLFEQPVKVSGSVSLQYQPHAGRPDFQLTPNAVMPGAPQVDASPSLFGWSKGSCIDTLAFDCAAYGPNSPVQRKADCYAQVEGSYSSPLYAAMGGASLDFNALAERCTAAATAKDFKSSAAADCGLLAPVACALDAAANSSHDPRLEQIFNRLLKETLAPPLLVAQNHVVEALKDSFDAGGALSELQRYDAAMTALDPAAQWVFMPSVIEYLRTMDPANAEGAVDPKIVQSKNESYPGARAFSKLLNVMTTIDGERSRISGIATPSKHAALVTQAQARAVLSYFETVTLIDTLNEWKIAPPTIAADFTGVLTPIDSGFGDLLRGAGVFGVPDSFVPFVFNPKDLGKGATNFAQMAAIASEAVSSYKALEDEYKTNGRTFEQNEAALRQESLQVQTVYDTQIANTCGSSFDTTPLPTIPDWANCGADHSGEVGILRLQIDEAQSRLQSSLSRIQGLKDKIAIDRRVLADTQAVHEETLNFIDDTGKELDAVTWSIGVINAEQAFIQTAANSQVLNFGAPAGLGVINAALEIEKTALEVRRQDVQTAQTMHAERANASIELINGLGNIQKETIDLAQLAVEIQGDVIALDEARARALNAVDQARRVYGDKLKTEAVTVLSPAHDPSFRLLRDQQGLNLLGSRARAQRLLFLAGQALQYEINDPVSSLPGAVLNARNALSMAQLTSCLRQVSDSYQAAYGVPQSYATTVSIREMLGITGPRTDQVTGQELSEGEQFRQILLKNQNLDGKGGVGVTFATNLQPGNQLWSTDVCADRITSIQAQLVGDFLGNNEAQVNLSMSGAAILRDCSADSLRSWAFGTQSGGSDSLAIIQAGVNSYGTSPENTSLFGESVARASWRIVVPGPNSAPANADLDLTHLDDIALQIKHEALPQKDSPLAVDLSCLASIK